VKVSGSSLVFARWVFIALVLLANTPFLYAQADKERKVTSPSAAVYVEMGGPALGWLSIHGEICFYRFEHEEIFGNTVHSLRLSIGATTAPVDRYYLPLVVKLLMFESDHHIEVGTGLSLLLKQVEIDDGFRHSFPASPVVMSFALGYRFEPQNGGFQFRWVYSPIYEFTTGELYPFVGISFGLSF
jgi:hypothetical protein